MHGCLYARARTANLFWLYLTDPQPVAMSRISLEREKEFAKMRLGAEQVSTCAGAPRKAKLIRVTLGASFCSEQYFP